jgi:hypothetical protein
MIDQTPHYPQVTCKSTTVQLMTGFSIIKATYESIGGKTTSPPEVVFLDSGSPERAFGGVVILRGVQIAMVEVERSNKV